MVFVNDTSSKFTGRFIIQGFIVDVMTTDEKILGFSNRWYSEGFKTAITYRIDEQHIVKIFSAPYFLACKIEAFKNRGNNDGRTSSDFEDIVFVLENRNAVWQDMENAKASVKQYLQNEFSVLLANKYIEEWIDVHVSFQSPSSTYYILEQLKNFIKKGKL